MSCTSRTLRRGMVDAWGTYLAGGLAVIRDFAPDDVDFYLGDPYPVLRRLRRGRSNQHHHVAPPDDSNVRPPV